MSNVRDEGRIADMTEAMQAALALGGGLGGTLSIKVDPASLIPLLTAQTTAILDSISGIGAVDNTAAFAQIRSDIAAIPAVQPMLDTLKTQIVSAIPAPVSLAQVNAKLDAILAGMNITPPPPPPVVNPPTIMLAVNILASTAPGSVQLVPSVSTDVTQVECYRNGVLFYTKPSPPFGYTDTGLPVGTYTYTEKAYGPGGSTVSNPVQVVIGPAVVVPPPTDPVTPVVIITI